MKQFLLTDYSYLKFTAYIHENDNLYKKLLITLYKVVLLHFFFMEFEFNNHNVNQAEPEGTPFFPAQTQAPNHFLLQTEAEDDELIKTEDGVIKLRFFSFESLFNLILNVNPSTNTFSKKLKRIEETGDVEALRHEIIDRDLKRALRAALKKNSVFKAVHALFKREFSGLPEFYCSVLSVFVKTSLPKVLNECLRSGDLTRAGRLLPYLVCLCHAFFCQSLDLNRISQIQEFASSHLYLEIEENQNRFLFDRRIELKEFLIMKMKKPRKGTYLHVEIPTETMKASKHSVYLAWTKIE